MAEKHWHMLRAKRNKLLEATDKYMLPDFPIDTKTKGLYREYREYLRKLPTMFNDGNVTKATVKSFEQWLDFKRTGNY